jgi:hypothetical protein
MTYSKPELNTLANAIKAIDSTNKGQQCTENASPHNLDSTINAYEADE